MVGLSVGSEAAFALAQEHLCGEIFLADFDRLELSNMNRLSSGVDDLEEPKWRILARRIAKMDPYLKIRILPNGVHENNLEALLSEIDLLIDECDSMPIKFKLRQCAQKLKVNIVFAGDERGFLSVEPYGQQELRIFHGRVSQAQPSRRGYPTELDYFKALTMWLGGWEAISERSRDSLRSVGKRLGGYPQLASETRYAAGQIGHVARRLLLGKRVAPFVGHLDLDRLVPAAETKMAGH